MKDIIINALTEALKEFEKRVPQTKTITKSISIKDIKPIELLSFMKKKDIPDTARFNGRDNGYDGWDDILLSWDVKIPTTNKDKDEYRKRVFSTTAFQTVYNLLTNNGYKRVPYNASQLNEFKNKTVYGMLINKEYDKLVNYYSLAFKPK